MAIALYIIAAHAIIIGSAYICGGAAGMMDNKRKPPKTILGGIGMFSAIVFTNSLYPLVVDIGKNWSRREDQRNCIKTGFLVLAVGIVCLWLAAAIRGNPIEDPSSPVISQPNQVVQ